MATVEVVTPAATPARSVPRKIDEAFLNYIFFDANKSEAFNVQPEDLRVSGPPPLAHDTERKGPSNLARYKPKKKSGILDEEYKYTEQTPNIGRIYHDIDLVDVLANEELLEDLAITIAERGVVFFKDQHNLSAKQQKDLINKLGLAAGKPKTSGLHRHPVTLTGGLLDGDKIDPEISLISSVKIKKNFYQQESKSEKVPSIKIAQSPFSRDTFKTGWHSDITFEPVPSDYTSLRIVESPSGSATDEDLAKPGGGAVGGSGGDTLWASGYALAERLSPPFLAFLETLVGEYSQPFFKEVTDSAGAPFYNAPRGAPENVGDELIAYHPVVRTNPVTGWKSVFAIGEHFNKFVGLSPSESTIIKDYIARVLVSSPEIQVRYKWDKGDLAIWDNRSAYHTAINDLFDQPNTIRTGIRTVGIGERPFFDPNSKLRHEALSSEQETVK